MSLSKKGIHPKMEWVKGQVAWNKGISPEKQKCLYCDMEVSVSNLKRWHNDNCRNKTKI